MTTGAAHGHVQGVRGRHERARPTGEDPGGQDRRRDVQRERRRDPLAGGIQHPLVDHVGSAVVSLLAGLEHEHHVTGQPVLFRREGMSSPHQHRGVQVMPAGVHDVAGRGVLHATALGHRQRVHVASQEHRSLPAADPTAHGGDRREGATGRHLQGKAVECTKHPLLGARELEAELGGRMQVVAQLDEVVLDGEGGVSEAHPGNVRALRGGGSF